MELQNEFDFWIFFSLTFVSVHSCCNIYSFYFTTVFCRHMSSVPPKNWNDPLIRSRSSDWSDSWKHITCQCELLLLPDFHLKWQKCNKYCQWNVRAKNIHRHINSWHYILYINVKTLYIQCCNFILKSNCYYI